MWNENILETLLDSPNAPLEQAYLIYQIGWLVGRRLGIQLGRQYSTSDLQRSGPNFNRCDVSSTCCSSNTTLKINPVNTSHWSSYAYFCNFTCLLNGAWVLDIVASKFYEIVVQCGKSLTLLENTSVAMAHAKSVLDEQMYSDAMSGGLQASQIRPTLSAIIASFEGYQRIQGERSTGYENRANRDTTRHAGTSPQS